ncbi:MAG TPA: 50S ribosomal protein L11 methyltransferase [Vicinamibacterales bacterium]
MEPSARRTWPALVVSGLDDASADLLQADLVDFAVDAIDESAPDGWRIFFSSADSRDKALAHVRRTYPACTATPLDVDDEDWAARSQAALRAVTVGTIIVAPPWDVPTTIVIQPSMGFGTGHHATTRLCLRSLQHLDVRGRSVIDVGTGSGVLAIAASRLGADPVQAFDDDEDAVHAAWENLALNPGAVVTMLVGDLRSLALDRADVVLANLTGGLLMASAARLLALVRPSGHLVLSGFQTHEEGEVVAAFTGTSLVERLEEENWVAVTLRSITKP